jgi:DNA-binding winged helix-turn-helix (wHTH) protein
LKSPENFLKGIESATMDAQTNGVVYEFDGFHLDVLRRCLYDKNGRPLRLSSRAFDLLLLMVQHPGELLSKTTLLEVVWPQACVEDNNLSQCIFALRRALGETAKEHRYIATIPGRGYQFVAPVRQLALQPTIMKGAHSKRRAVLLGIAGMVAVALIAAAFVL